MEMIASFTSRDESRHSRRRAQPSFPTLYFRDGILSIPGYAFEKAVLWEDTGSLTQLAEGSSLKDGSNVLAKIAPAHTTASVCLEREAHILGRMHASPESLRTMLRLIDFFSISQADGDAVVLLLVHPGPNMLGRYLPRSKVNDLLLAEPSRTLPSTSHGDIFMGDMENNAYEGDPDSTDTMDLATFLEFAVQATHCLEQMHKLGIIHREVRANAYHINAHSGIVRIVHFGNRSISLEQFGGPSSLVIRADAFEEMNKVKVKEALCYLAPEQTGSVETTVEDHRTDLYSLGIMFWALLVGRGMMPFEGGPMEILHSIVQKRPMPVHEVRRDIPQVLAQIIEKLLSKNPDQRYQSAHGLKADLLECQKRLLVAVSSVSEQSLELIPSFEIARQDRYMEFTIPNILFGRERELDIIRNVIRHASTSFSRYTAFSKGTLSLSSSQSTKTVESGANADSDDSKSSRSEMSLQNASTRESERADKSVLSGIPPSQDSGIGSIGSPLTSVSDGLRRAALGPPTMRTTHAHGVIVVGPAGVGKSSLVLANQAKWRSHGLWGHAKFQNSVAAPFAALLSCLSSVLRQLMVFHSDLHRFITSLKTRLGPQLRILPLLYEGVPELQDIMALFDDNVEAPQESLATRELRARFQSLVENVFAVLAETRLFALFLDDLHEADDSSLDLISSLASSKSRILIFMTLREDFTDIKERVANMFTGRSRATWIHLEPLPYSAIATLTSRTMHQSKEDVAPLSRLVHAASGGNAFSARNILATLQRQHYISFDWERNCWQFDLASIETNMLSQKGMADPNDISYLQTQLNQLPDDARKYIIWASFFGSTFKVTDVALVMDHEESSSGSDPDSELEGWIQTRVPSSGKRSPMHMGRSSMRGLQIAIAEGWLVQRARDMCGFAHDRYRQAAEAEAANLTEASVAKMSFKIILMMLHESTPDIYRIAERAQRCLSLLRAHNKREELITLLINAGDSAWARGAHELAYQSLINARDMLDGDAWSINPTRTASLLTKLAELSTWRGDYALSDKYVEECLQRAERVEDKALLLRQRSRNHWMRNNFSAALDDTLLALHVLGVEINAAPSRMEADVMFEQVKNEILAVGFDAILAIPRASDPRTDLAVTLLGDAGVNAYWSTGEGFADIIGLTTIQLALRSGMSPGTALGFFWTLGAAAEKKELYRFSADLGKLALRIAQRHGTSSEKCRALVMFCSMVSGYDNVHIRANVRRLEEAAKYANSAGDRVYASFASYYIIETKLFSCEHLEELVIAAEESFNDIKLWTPHGDSTIFAMGLLNCIRALGGWTTASSADTIYDTDTFVEREYLAHVSTASGNLAMVMNWYNSFKVVALFCLGFTREAAALGFDVYNSRSKHPNHRHNRYALFFHSLAMIACVRDNLVDDLAKKRYIRQIPINQSYIRRWLSPSPVNTSTWVALVDAEMSSLENSPESFKLYDIAVKLAVNNDWLLEEGWALYLQGSHFIRCGVEGLGTELQRRGISRQNQWGARGIVASLSPALGAHPQESLKRHIFTNNVGVQTDGVMMGVTVPSQPLDFFDEEKMDTSEETDMTSLPASDLASVLKWSKEIASDIHLFSALQRLTEIATETSGAQSACIVISGEAGDYAVATTMSPPDICKVHENPLPLRMISDPLQRAIIQHALNTKERISYDDVSSDSRFASEAQQSPHRSVLCLPIFSNRGQTFGALYMASRYPFSHNTVTLLTLLVQQANISVANALLFRSVQAGTRENLKMISSQREALEAARRSREDALKATKIKSNFLASMSHELRTPFSSFYGLLDILSGTELNSGQNEIVQTAKQSCELLLKIIDSILDYSKLEASAVKLEYSGFSVENIIADCMELLLPSAASKLDLSFNIDKDVPRWVTADYARIRQILMNLIGNAVKFTSEGSVKVLCSVDRSSTLPSHEGDINLKFVIQDTGIGLSAKDVDLLFVPFQQADNSSTRRFGGTGLGLSICRQLVKLMGGVIGVHSELGKGSMFWFTIPTKTFDSEESRKAEADIEHVKTQVMKMRIPRILISSLSDATSGLLKNMLEGFHVTTVSVLPELEAYLRNAGTMDGPLDFIFLDHQAEEAAEETARLIKTLNLPMLKDTKIIHFYTPVTNNSSSGTQMLRSDIPGVVRLTKPPRKLRILQTMASMMNLPKEAYTTAETSMDTHEAAGARTLFGNVLIAEDNPVAQKLLVKQLERFDLNVVATSNGEEAIREWESHEPGYFSVALFDHHMPICDGVEAVKRLRRLEERRKVSEFLPVIALSADCQESTKRLCLSAGMNAFLAKPLKKPDLNHLLTSFGTPNPGGNG
ncbi:histidine kinase [Dentipellis sp. KUC8613]|nr:histidine kinase [Dentipellis sp. KUC8613]